MSIARDLRNKLYDDLVRDISRFVDLAEIADIGMNEQMTIVCATLSRMLVRITDTIGLSREKVCEIVMKAPRVDDEQAPPPKRKRGRK